MSTSVRYGWSARTIQSPACTLTLPALKAALAVWISTPWRFSSFTRSAALNRARWPAGTTQA